MDAARDALPDDIAALKEALIIERAKALEVAAELAVARAKASEDVALIAQQKLRIAKLERQVYGQRSERSARLIDQLALDVRRAGSRRHGRRTRGGGGGRQDDIGARIYAQATRAQHIPRSPSPRARGDRSADGMRMLWRQSPAQTRRGRDANAGNAASPVEGDRDGAGEVHLPRLREDHASAGAVPCHREGMGGAEPPGHDHVREVRSASASEPPGRALRSGRRADRAVDNGRRRGVGLRGARSPPSPCGSPCHGGRALACG